MYDAADYCALRRKCRGFGFRQLLPEAWLTAAPPDAPSP
jgi:hypothetical protein